MGWFSSSKKIKENDFEKTIKDIPQLSDEERAYVKGIFKDSLRDGLSGEELKKEISQLKRDSNDSLNSFEIKKLKKRLEENLKK